jgi:hypothetical protein
MIFASALLLLTPPYIPPTGPISGAFECLLDRPSRSEPAALYIHEDRDEQVSIRGTFPIDFEVVESVTIGGDRSISVVGKKDDQVLMRLVPIDQGIGTTWWRVEGRALDGSYFDAGICSGNLLGRLDRPVSLRKIRMFRVEVLGAAQ